MNEIVTWLLFNVFVLIALAIDLGITKNAQKPISVKEGAIRWGIWVFLAFLFFLWIYAAKGHEAGLKFATGYLIEQALSIDNLFVFLSIFTYFSVDRKYIHRVLFWGILGAIIFRAIFIFTGVILINNFHFIVYLFGLFVILAGVKMALKGIEKIDPKKNVILKFFKKILPLTSEFHDDSFFIKEFSYWKATPLFVVLLMIETSDVIFAFDSVPAILAITTDPFLVYTSNVFAILGLRSLYFCLEGMFGVFKYLHYGLAAMLVFIGIKMVIADFIPISIGLSLGVIFAILALSIGLSLCLKTANKH